MNRFNFKRQEISIQEIGTLRFWFGIAIGLSVAVILSFFFNYGREFMRIFSVLDADLLMVSDSTFLFFNYFFISLATALGFSLTVSTWFIGNKMLSRRKRMIKRLSITSNVLIFVITINFVIRLGSLIGFVPYGMLGYEDQLNLINEFGNILFLLPINVYLISWYLTRLIYKTGKWILVSVPICILIIFILTKITVVDRSIVNSKFYFGLYEEELEYIDREIQKVQSSYQIEFTEETLHTLRKWQNEDVYNLVSDLKRSFESEKTVTLDSIILSRITVHTLKLDGGPIYNYQKKKFNWDYPSPNSIYQQISKHDPLSPEAFELAKLFGEEIKLINSHVITFGDSLELYDRKDYSKSNFIYNRLTVNIYNEADSVRNVILNKGDLPIPDSLLPVLNQDYRRPSFNDN